MLRAKDGNHDIQKELKNIDLTNRPTQTLGCLCVWKEPQSTFKRVVITRLFQLEFAEIMTIDDRRRRVVPINALSGRYHRRFI
jgi:hypothetical protein